MCGTDCADDADRRSGYQRIPAERGPTERATSPGDTIQSAERFEQAGEYPLVNWELQPNRGWPRRPRPWNPEFYTVITKVVSQEFGGAPALPFQSTWLTDRTAVARLHQVQATGWFRFRCHR